MNRNSYFRNLISDENNGLRTEDVIMDSDSVLDCVRETAEWQVRFGPSEGETRSAKQIVKAAIEEDLWGNTFSTVAERYGGEFELEIILDIVAETLAREAIARARFRLGCPQPEDRATDDRG